MATFFPEYAVAASSTVTQTDNTTLASPYASMVDFDYIDFVINTTDASADTTVDAKLQEATDSSGTGVADITGLAITQGTAANASEVYVLRVRSDQLSGQNTHVRCLLTAGNGTVGVTASIVALGFCSNYAPATDYDAATVLQIVNI